MNQTIHQRMTNKKNYTRLRAGIDLKYTPTPFIDELAKAIKKSNEAEKLERDAYKKTLLGKVDAFFDNLYFFISGQPRIRW